MTTSVAPSSALAPKARLERAVLALTVMLVLSAQSPDVELAPVAAPRETAIDETQEESSTMHRMLVMGSGIAAPIAMMAILVGTGALLATGGIWIARMAVPGAQQFNTPLLAAGGLTMGIAAFALVAFVVAVTASVGLIVISRFVP